MKQITFQFVSTGSLIDKIIEWRTDSDIAHVDVVTPEGGKLLGAQLKEPASAGGPGVQVRQPDYAKFTEQIRVVLTVEDQQFADFWHFVYSQVGKPYDIRAIFGLSFHRDWRETNKWFCSELHAAGLEYAKILVIDQDVNWVDPQTLLELLCASSHFLSKYSFSSKASSSYQT